MESKMDGVLKRVLLAHSPVDSMEAKMKQYSDWSANYEEDVADFEYRAPKLAVDFFLKVIQENGRELPVQSKIIDFAAGSGLVANNLRKGGCTYQIDAQDGSAGMLKVAKEKGIYRDFYECLLLPDVELPIPKSIYDAGFVIGALSDNQVSWRCLQSMLNHIKVNGLMIFSARDNKSNLSYKAALEDEIARLEVNKVWKKVAVQNVDIFEKATCADEATIKENGPCSYISGTIYCYQKL